MGHDILRKIATEEGASYRSGTAPNPHSTPIALTLGGWGFGLSIFATLVTVAGAIDSYDSEIYAMWAWLFSFLSGIFFCVLLCGLIVSAIRTSAAEIVASLKVDAPTNE